MRPRTPLTALCVAAAVVAPPAAAAPTPGWPPCAAARAPAQIGAQVTDRARAGRVLTLAVRSRAMRGLQRVEVLLPRGYDASGRTRYPVLYAFHGAGGDRRTFLDDLGIERAVGARRLIVVMPDGSADGRNGEYTDWFGFEGGRTYAWETFHVHELVPLVDRTLPTRATPGARAVTGISMGGGGLRYAAKHPGLFGSASAFSAAVAPAAGRPDCVRGDPALHPVLWRGDSAIDLARNLRGVRLFLRSGDGSPGPFDAPAPGDALQQRRAQTERLAAAGQGLLVTALREAGVTGADARTYAGTHRREYWVRELPGMLRWLDAQLRRPVRTRTTFRVDSARERFVAWGWSFRVRRRVREFVYVDVDGPRITARGSGRLEVTAPARYGRRRVVLDLGPSHRREQTDFSRTVTASWRTATATVR